MTLGGEDGTSRKKKIKRPDEDLPWVLDSKRLENWSDQEMYDLEVSFREWLFKAMKNHSWKVPKGKGKWNQGSRMTFNKIREQFGIKPSDSMDVARLLKLCKHYALKVRHGKSPIEVKGKRQSQTGYYLPREPKQVKLPYNLRMRFEMLMAEGKDVSDLRSMPMPDKFEKTLVEMDRTRRLQNKKSSEYYQRWKEKYGESGTDSISDEDPDSGSRMDS